MVLKNLWHVRLIGFGRQGSVRLVVHEHTGMRCLKFTNAAQLLHMLLDVDIKAYISHIVHIDIDNCGKYIKK